MDGLVGNLGRVGEVIEAAPFLDRREIVRGMTHQITVDAVEMRGEVGFYSVPQLVFAGDANDKSPNGDADGLSLCMAGARDSARETGQVERTVLKSFAISGLRRCT